MNCTCEHNNKAEDLIPKVDAIIDRIGTSRQVIIPLLQALQEAFSYLPSEAIERVYERTEIDRAQLISVSTFYSQFRHIPYGKHLIKVCTGTACHVKGAGNVYDSFRRELKMEDGSITSSDQLFSIEKIACLGCCTLAPVVQIDEKIYGHVMPGKVNEVIDDFLNLQEKKEKEENKQEQRQVAGEIRLGMGSCCQASGSSDIYKELLTASDELGIEVNIKPVGCVGVCNKVPLIDVVLPDSSITRYPNVKAIEIKEILHHHFKPAGYLKRLKNSLLNHIDTFHTDITWDNVIWKGENERTGVIDSFLSGQKHISTEGYGFLAPLNIDEYVASGGFEALKAIVSSRSREEVIQSILSSGIRGRGGGGFPTGKKWEIVAASPKKEKYVICNGDEGDPGAFMDRMMLESYPFRVIEGMIIAGYAVGADKGVFYIRAEYPLAVVRIRTALELCRERNLIGENIAGSGFSFDISIFEGAGAFVCGEETALIASIEGERGFPKQRPPYPAVEGLNGRPTLVNNVETLSQIPYILRNGSDYYGGIGTSGSKGTKVFALAGKIRHGGLIEVPMGVTLNQIIEDIGGGVEGGEKLKAVQIGGPSGGCIPAHLCDVQVDFDAFNQMGAMMGSGGLVVLSESDCMVDMARYFLSFTCEQSCGKCTFCRVGIRRMLDLLDKICSGKADMADIDKLEELALNVKKSSLCGLGKTAPNPVLTTLKYFREEYEEHVKGVCKTGTCKDMVKYVVTDECIGCTKCAKACPVDAIPYTPYEIHSIEVETCVQCGLCIDECSFNAIRKVALNEHVNYKDKVVTTA
ncbi:NADH-quinone oxidoreductase subunit F [Parabacteroides sp. PF5-5]|uniref:NAD(P)H-dependent oxidoreductase subunit E n=1 Tax=unclassified Parabacteroides TaxID=2649774 RepID=UPI00247675D0|nr:MULTISPECIES: NAD(P)H-dependent oxidoreductase subunit E [unclassified Parabacteroides]MDH6303729.1 NADH-quinone oxidoreductase subunit F [Parabacteroides sp. PH5-39]MDH6314346.1 NADH-quinone oxidoreductase subunit F [Parabacteroides sp. PF5-13]MDH6318589.1 NADH-quinone oxidoreductase subunit F [Parabacteroides sp. PH5-13]MDH6322118.1 NADH-quinone oxidoreductase subunit F [Parabacteroides sp. PH5-8]MDH6325802.1 NADH-quinone oxidoreductase subunit F [Parabacteroides sp. PH5-41]